VTYRQLETRCLLVCLIVTLPAAAPAVCGGGGTSSLPAPAVAYLRSYRASFGAPTRLALDASGNVYVADPAQGRVVVRAPSGRILATVGGLGRPVSIAVDANGRRYVGNGAAGNVTAYGGDWQPLFQLGQGAGEFLLPNDLAIDATSGNLYVADSPAHTIKVYSAAGTFLYSFGGHGSGDGQLNYPTGIVIDAASRQVLVADQLNYRVQVFDVSGTFQSCFGGQGSGTGKFDLPQGIALDSLGRVYVSDALEGRIQVLDRSGGFVAYVGDFGDAAGRLRLPIGMAVDPSNRLFVAAANNARLEVFGLDTFTDPETTIPAVLHVFPNPIERATPSGAVVAYVEAPGYALDQIAPGSVTANGVVATTTPIRIGDHDGNGVPDARFEFDWTALLATLPTGGSATITLTGLLGALHFEAAADVAITMCGPGTVCPIGDADPQCTTAVCLAGVGCSLQSKSDGVGCEDGNACTIGDVCSSGACVGTPLTCTDGNGCTDDSCDPVSGCVFVNNTSPCDDANVCTTTDTCAGGVCAGEAVTCNDGNGCTDDTCNPATGCVYTPNSLPCDDANPCTDNDTCVQGSCSGVPVACDDGNVCTDDACTPISGCIHTPNNLPCDDADACTGPDTCTGGVCRGIAVTCDDGNVCTDDTCNPASGCLHTGNRAACDDGDAGTLHDTCDGLGSCRGQATTGRYAILGWPLQPHRHRSAILSGLAVVRGNVCTERMRVGSSDRIDGDAIAWAALGRAATLRRGSQVTGAVVTGGGTVIGLDQATVGGGIDLGGAAPQLDECFAARVRATSRRADLLALPPTPGFTLAPIQLGPGTTRRIPATGAMGTGQIIIEADRLRMGSSSVLTLVGSAATDAVIVHLRGSMTLGRAARITVEGIAAERLILLIDGSVVLHPRASVVGSVFAAAHVHMGSASTISGALLGATIDLAPSAAVDLHPFTGW